jgi:hypothetical protein
MNRVLKFSSIAHVHPERSAIVGQRVKGAVAVRRPRIDEDALTTIGLFSMAATTIVGIVAALWG